MVLMVLMMLMLMWLMLLVRLMLLMMVVLVLLRRIAPHRLSTMYVWHRRELEPDLQCIAVPFAKQCHQIPRHPASDELLRLGITVWVQSPGEHSLPDQRHVWLGVVGGIDGVVVVLLVDDLGTALCDGGETCPEVNNANRVSVVKGNRLDV